MPHRSGRRPASIADVAREAGVSVGTVSNVLNTPHIVAKLTRQRVETALRTTGFVRNAAARSLTGAPGSTVGCVVLDLSNPYFAAVARGLEDGLTARGCLAIICSSDIDADRQSRCMQTLLENRVRGIVLNAVPAVLPELEAMLRAGVPITLLDNPDFDLDVCSVSSDNQTGGLQAAGHLLDLGHRRIALLRHELDIPPLQDRILGARRAAVDRGLEPDAVFREIVVRSSARDRLAGFIIDDMLAGASCTAALCYNDMTALAVLAALRERDITVPDQVSVIGYDDLDFAGLLFPALTTVRQPTYRLGRAAAELVLSEGEPRHRHRKALLVPDLVVRASTAPPPS